MLRKMERFKTQIYNAKSNSILFQEMPMERLNVLKLKPRKKIVMVLPMYFQFSENFTNKLHRK